MNKNSGRLRRLLIALIIGISILIVFQNKTNFSRQKKFFSKKDIKKIESIKIVNQSATMTIRIEKEQWAATNEKTKIVKNVSKNKINILYNSVLGLNKSEIVSKNRNKYDEFDVSGSTRLELQFKNSTVHLPGKKSKTVVIYIGTTDYRKGTYFRVSSDPVVYRTNTDLKSALLIQ